MTTVAVLGAGNWGTTFAQVCADAGSQVRLWARDPGLAATIRRTRENPEYLPGVTLDDAIEVTSDVGAALHGADVVAVAVPSPEMRDAMGMCGPHIPEGAVVVSLSKGIEPGTCLRMTEVIHLVAGIPANRLAVLTGPNLASEIAAHQSAAAVVASVSEPVAELVAEACSAPYFLVGVETDVIGCEIAGAVKNVVAVCVGMADGMGMGENTKSTLITRGLAETMRLGVALGAEPETFSGLAGAGDLIATCMSPLSRNHQVGFGLGQGHPIMEVLSSQRQIAEGVKSCESVLALAQRLHVDMPIVEAVVAVVHDGQLPALIADALMARERKAEKPTRS